MAFRIKFSILLSFFSLHLLLFYTSKICCSNDCPLSSCGSISNISYPFRLKDDPKNCGDPHYELVCENNFTTVLYLNSKRFIVLSITYHNFTIRLVDPGLEKYNQGHSSCPLHNLRHHDLYNSDYIYGTSYHLNNFWMFISCSSPIRISNPKDNLFYKTTLCGSNSSSSANQVKYSYVVSDKYNSISLSEVRPSCSVNWVTMVSQNAPVVSNDSEFADSSYGFELRWYFAHCIRCFDKGGDWCHLDGVLPGTSNLVCEKWCSLTKGPSTLLKLKCVLHGIRETLNWLFYAYNYKYSLRLTGEILGARFFLGTLFLISLLVYKKRRMHLSMYDSIENFLQGQNNLVPIRYSYAEVKRMTHNFRDKLGEGGYGTVFKGKLRSALVVAVKMMGKSKTSGEEFISEVATIGRIHHVNVVNLIGFCFEGSKRALVYEFMPNGSLEKYIFPQDGEMKSMGWENMFKISLGVARGMDYLHRGCEMQILHFDIKPHNILLDESFNPKISDFGLAKLYPANDSIVSLTAARGTMGYMAPELFYKNIGRVSYKADVYSFGMLLMEMAGKRKNLNPFVDHLSQIYFPSWVHDQFSQGKEIEMKDATDDEKKVVKKMILVALWCIQMNPSDRPSMNKVVEMLEGELDLLEMPPKPFLSPEGMQDDHQDREVSMNHAELPLLLTI